MAFKPIERKDDEDKSFLGRLKSRYSKTQKKRKEERDKRAAELKKRREAAKNKNKPVAKQIDSNDRKRKSTAKLPEVEKKTKTQREQDAQRKDPVPKTRITDDKGARRFLERDKLRKTAREATKVEKPPKVESAADSLRAGTARNVAEAKRKGLGTFTNVKGDEKAAVTKEELEASGMSLRDYLNKQQGKTRRGMKKGGAVKKPFKTGDLVKAKPKAKKKIRGAGKEIKGLRPCKMR